jgi:pimeloyl-ACP methyl ester carboxylesterase
MRMMLIRAAAAVVLLWGGSAAAQPAASFKPHEFKPDAGDVVAAELGELSVPESRTKPGSRPITLRFVRFKSTATKPGHPIVYLAGGPGGSGIDAAKGSRFPLFMAMREFGDVIAFDQRGTGFSEPDTRCSEQYIVDPSSPLSREKAGAAMGEALSKCLAKLPGVDLTALNTRESAADLADLRKALGAEKLVLWGISYGTHLAIATMRDHGAIIDRVILAGIEGPDETYKLPSDQQTLMEEIARLASKEPTVRERVPDLLGAITRISAELEARPKKVMLAHPSGMSAEIALGKLDLQSVLANMLQGPESFAAMPDLVGRVDRGDWTGLALATMRTRMGRLPSAMTVAMDCASGISDARRAVIREEASRTLLGDAINMPFPEICTSVKVPDLGDAFRAPLRTDIPALLISGTLDGRTRPRQAEELRRGMPRAVHLVIEGAGHSDPLFLSSPKILEAMKRFMRGKDIGERFIELPPVEFVPPREVVTLSDEELAAFVGSYRIDAESKRSVVKAGSLLYTVRDGNPPFPIRPMSATEFFYEGSPGTVRFEKDGAGKLTAMVFTGADGKAHRSPRM